MNHRCRHCGIDLPADPDFEEQPFCSAEHKHAHELDSHRHGWSAKPADAVTDVRVRPVDARQRRSRGYPEERYRRAPSPALPRLRIGVLGGVGVEEEAVGEEAPEIGGRGIYPYFFWRLVAVAEPPARVPRAEEKAVKQLWWKTTVSPTPKRKTKGFPSHSPKGFTSEVPMSGLQPSFRVLSGDFSMAGTLSPSKPRESGANFHPGPPNMHLSAVRQSALRLAEKRCKEMAWPTAGVDCSSFAPAVEWRNTTKLNFDTTGFNFLGDPQPKKPGRQVADGSIVNVAAVLAEAEIENSSARREIRLEPIVWDEIDAGDAAPLDDDALQSLSKALELYEPPATPKPEAKVEPVVEIAPEVSTAVEADIDEETSTELLEPEAEPESTAVEGLIIEAEVVEEVEKEEPFDAPQMADMLAVTRPELRKAAGFDPVAPPDPVAASGSRIHLPTVSIAPLRRPLVWGPSPATPAPAKPVEAPVETKAVAAPAVETPAPPEAKIEDPKTQEPARPAEHAKPATDGKVHGRKKKKHLRQGGRSDTDDPIEEPDDLGEEIEAELLAAQKVTDKPAENPAQPAAAAAVLDEKTVEKKAGKIPDTAKIDLKAEPSTIPTPSFGGMAESETKAPRSDTFGLGLSRPESELITPVTGMGMGAKIGIAAAVVVMIGAIIFAVSGGPDKKANGPITDVGVGLLETAGIVTGEAGWSTDYATDASGKRLRQISLYRPSMQIADYRVEFQAEIEYKAVSWVVRATGVKSHYILKLAQSGPQTRLQRMPVVDNKVGDMVEKDLPFHTNLGMLYRVQMDVVGDKYRVTINDKLVEEWKYAALTGGGFGVANEGAERGQVRAIQMWHLRERPASK